MILVGGFPITGGTYFSINGFNSYSLLCGPTARANNKFIDEPSTPPTTHIYSPPICVIKHSSTETEGEFSSSLYPCNPLSTASGENLRKNNLFFERV